MQVYQLTVVQLTVVAQDRGPDAMPTDAAVVVRIIDVNDNAPTIVVNTLASRGGGGGGGAVAEVPENLPAGTFVAHVTVADADSGQFGRVDCNLTEHAFALLRRPDSTEFQVSFLVQFRAELRRITRFVCNVPRCIKCSRGIAMRILSDRLSVCLSVRLSVKCVHCEKTEESCVWIFISYERTFILVF